MICLRQKRLLKTFLSNFNYTEIHLTKSKCLKIHAPRFKTLTLGRNLRIQESTNIQVLWGYWKHRITNYPTTELFLKKRFSS